MELKDLAIGAGLALLVLLIFRLANIHRERGSYAVLLLAVVLPHVVVAADTHEADLLYQGLILSGFTAIAMAGARWNLWLVVFGFVAHAALVAIAHYTSLLELTPTWYGAVCLGFDLVIAIGLAGFLAQGRKLSDMT